MLTDPDTKSRVNALDYICSGGEVRGMRFLQTKHGLDVQTGPTFVGQGHQDQYVAEMAQWGIAMSHYHGLWDSGDVVAGRAALRQAQQIAASIGTSLRTTDAAKVDDALIGTIENALMKLSETISSSYLTHNERSEALWEALA